jgi:hypothetical protein
MKRAAAHLVHFIEHHQAMAGSGFAYALDDVARQGTDVRAAVTANLGFVVHAA